MDPDATLAPAHAALLGLLGPESTQAPELTDNLWRAVNAIAQDQRLQPHLHARLQRGEIAAAVPAEIAQSWKWAHRSSAMTTLIQRRDLIKIAEILDAARITVIALKGAWLSWHAFPDPAERVLRDLDLLVTIESAPTALELLLEAGLTPLDPLPDDPAAFADALVKLRDDSDRRNVQGANGRDLALERFDRSKLADQFCQLLESVSRETKGS